MDKDLLEDRRRALEEEYFKKESQELAHKLHLRLTEKQIGEKTGVADQDLLARMAALGFGPETIALLPLVPLIYVAWADGEVSSAERAALLDIAHKRLAADQGEAGARLRALLDKRPDNRFFDTTFEMIRKMRAASPETALDLSALCRQIAEASGGLLGLGKVSADERTALDQIAAALESSRKQATEEILKKL